jgi:AcrR family transcriptional regulator
VTKQRSSAPAERATAAPGQTPRQSTEEAFLDAAERLLVSVGYAGITTRSLAEEAGANPGLVHYYFGSMENLFVRVLERFTDRLIARQREMYSADRPFLDKWRQAVRYLDFDRPYQKIWYELQALAWNRPELRDRVAWVDRQWRGVLLEAFAEPHRAYRVDMPLEALVALVITFNEGIILERLSGVETGQAELLEWIDRWLEERDYRAGRVTEAVSE